MSDSSGCLRFMKYHGDTINQVQKWKPAQSKINAIALLKGKDVAGAVVTEVNF